MFVHHNNKQYKLVYDGKDNSLKTAPYKKTCLKVRLRPRDNSLNIESLHEAS